MEQEISENEIKNLETLMEDKTRKQLPCDSVRRLIDTVRKQREALAATARTIMVVVDKIGLLKEGEK